MGRRGPKKQPGKREPSGRLSRETSAAKQRNIDHMQREEIETLSPALEARERIWGVGKDKSRDQLAGSFVGRLRLAGELSQPQYEAALIYLEECRNNSIACRSPKEPGAVDLNATHGASNFENVKRSVDARRRYEASRAAVMEKQIEIRGTGNLFGALSVCVLDDKPATNLVGDLRTALNALAKHYGIDGKARRAA